MPIYEYQCGDCNAAFELLVRGCENLNCPECSSAKLEKQLSVSASPKSGSGNLPIAPRSNLGAG